MRIVCPLYSDPYYSYTIDLSGDAYTLTFRWSSRSEQYIMSIDDAEDNNIIRSVALVPYYPLIQQYALENPIGEFFLMPLEQSGIENSSIPDPRRVDKTHILLYTDEV